MQGMLKFLTDQCIKQDNTVNSPFMDTSIIDGHLSNGVITWNPNKLRPVWICNFCSCLHETGIKHFVDYMRPVQTQKHEILGAIELS